MYKILRIICCVIAALFATACVLVFIYVSTFWGIATIVCALIFFLLTLMFKGLQEDKEKPQKKNDGFISSDQSSAAKTDENDNTDGQN